MFAVIDSSRQYEKRDLEEPLLWPATSFIIITCLRAVVFKAFYNWWCVTSVIKHSADEASFQLHSSPNRQTNLCICQTCDSVMYRAILKLNWSIMLYTITVVAFPQGILQFIISLALLASQTVTNKPDVKSNSLSNCIRIFHISVALNTRTVFQLFYLIMRLFAVLLLRGTKCC